MKSFLLRHGRRLGHASRHTVRWGYYLGAIVLALLAILYTVARLLFPQVESKKAEIEQYLSAKTAHAVRIEKLEAYWDGLLPGVHIQGLNVAATPEQRPSVRLAELHATFALLPLLWGNVEIRGLVLTRPSVTLERLTDGRLRISGFEPVAVDEPGADEKFINWLLRQQQLTVRDGEIAWVDRRHGVERLQLSEVQFDLRSRGERHKGGLRARFPAALCRECAVALDITGNPLRGDDWSGELYLRAAELDVDALPRIVRERLPESLQGRFDVELWSDWDDGVPDAVHGNIAVAALQLPLRGLAQPLRVGSARGNVDWRRSSDGWHLDVGQLMLGLHGRPWSAERLRVERDDDDHRLRIRHVELADLSSFITGLQGEHPLLRHWADMRPGGALDQVDIKIVGPLASPRDYRLRAELARVTWEPHNKIPGVQGLSGWLDMRRTDGEFHINTQDVALSLPDVFRAPLPAQRIQGLVSWERGTEGWRVIGKDVTLTSTDGVANGEMQLQLFDDARSPYLKVRADVKNGDGRHAAKYYPAPHLPPKILHWMDTAFLGGTITRGQVTFDGPVRDFPFDDGTGRFEVRAHVRDGSYRYLKGWAPVTHAEADVVVTGRDVLVTGTGRIGALTVNQVVVQTRPVSDPKKRRVAVTGKVQGPVAESLRVLREIETDADPAPVWQSYLPVLQAQGDGVLSLDVNVPLGVPGADFTGEYQVQGATLQMTAPALALRGLAGYVRFSNHGLEQSDLRAQLLGGAFEFKAARAANGVLNVASQGQILGSELGRLHGEAIAQRVSGSADWRLDWREQAGLGDMRFEVALDDLRLKLPPPFDRIDRPAAERLVLRTEQSRERFQLVSVDAGDLVRGKLALEHQNGWRLTRGHVGFGMNRVTLPARAGLQLSARLDRLDIDQWLPLLGSGSGVPPPAVLRGISAEIKRLDMFDRPWGRVYMDLTPAGNGWQALLDGDNAAGRARYVPANAQQPASAKLDLSMLKLPEKKHRGTDTPIEPRRLPAVDLRTTVFEYKARNVGEVDFSAAPFEQGWRIARFNVTRPEGRFSSRGTWREIGGRHSSAFDVELTTTDIGKTLEAFGAAGQVKGGKVDLRAHLAWAGSPTNPRIAGLDGRVEVAAEKGRFLQLDPGAARLFGLLDLRAITRYLTLDFSSVFGKGFAFDQIHGTVTIERGNAYVNDLLVKGPSVGLTAGGRVGLAAEDFDLVLEVTPKFSDTLTLTSWGLFGPQAAAAILAIQKLFKKQIAAGTRVTYLVKGAWDNPTVTKVGKDSDAKESSDETPPASE